jgi:hypothetical protein
VKKRLLIALVVLAALLLALYGLVWSDSELAHGA